MLDWRRRNKGDVLIVAARCPVCGEPVCPDRSTYQNNYECPLRLSPNVPFAYSPSPTANVPFAYSPSPTANVPFTYHLDRTVSGCSDECSGWPEEGPKRRSLASSGNCRPRCPGCPFQLFDGPIHYLSLRNRRKAPWRIDDRIEGQRDRFARRWSRASCSAQS